MKKTTIGLIILLTLFIIGCQDNNVVEPVTNDDVVIVEEIVTEKYYIPKSKVMKDTLKWGYVTTDHLDKFELAPQYDYLSLMNNESIAVAQKDGLYALIEKNGNPIVPYGTYTFIEKVNAYFFAKKPESGMDLLNATGEVITSTVDEYALRYTEGQILIYKEEGVFYFDEESQRVFKLEYDDSYYENISLAIQNINQIILLNYDEGRSQYYYTVNDAQLGGYYDYAEPFKDGTAIVGITNDSAHSYHNTFYYGLINASGVQVIPFDYIYMAYSGDDYLVMTDKNSLAEEDYFVLPYSDHAFKKGLYDLTGRPVFPDMFYVLNYVDEDLFQVHDGVNYYFINSKGVQQLNDIQLTSGYNFEKIGSMYQGTILRNTVYFDDQSILVENTYRVFEYGVVYNQTKGFGSEFVEYPVVELINASAEIKINEDIQSYFVTSGLGDSEVFYEEIDQSYEVFIDEKLLSVEISYYYYGYGAAHGNYYVSTKHYNLINGDFLELDDLFEASVDVNYYISELLADYDYEEPYFYQDMSELSREERIQFFTRDAYEVRVLNGMLEIYFNPYDIGPYAAGIIGFEFSLEDLDNLNENSAFME